MKPTCHSLSFRNFRILKALSMCFHDAGAHGEGTGILASSTARFASVAGAQTTIPYYLRLLILSQLTSYSISPYFHLAFADFAGHLSSLEMSRRTAGAYRLCAASNTTLGWWSGAPPQKKKHMFHGGLLQQNSNGSNGLESLLCISTSLQFH